MVSPSLTIASSDPLDNFCLIRWWAANSPPHRTIESHHVWDYLALLFTPPAFTETEG